MARPRPRPEEIGFPDSQLVRKTPSTAGFNQAQRNGLEDLTKRYLKFLGRGVVPHLVVDESIGLAAERGFVNGNHSDLGNKFYLAGPDDRSFALVDLGTTKQTKLKRTSEPSEPLHSDPLQNGIRFLASHIDSPCLVLKNRPLSFEWDPDEKELLPGVMLATVPYGGINTFQWNSIPVTIYGTGVRKGKRFERTLSGYIMGHSAHLDTEGTAAETLVTDRIKVTTGHTSRKAFLRELGFSSEDDFFTTMWYVIPDTAPNPKRLANDYLVGYGHDNRSGTFAAIEALFNAKSSPTVSVAIGFDYEETGSLGAGSAQGKFFEKVVDRIKNSLGSKLSNDEIIARSLCLSIDADYTAGPHEKEDKEGFDVRNIARIGYGVGLWNQGGLYYTSNIPIDFRSYVQEMVIRERIVAQYVGAAEIADYAQGAETVGYHLNNRGLLTLDVGPTVGGSHGLAELMHAGDLFWTVKLSKAFLSNTQPYKEIHKKRK